MAYEKLETLDCDVTVSLGGFNTKTNKANPKSVEGYYLGKKSIEDKKKKSGITNIYVFKTAKGNVGVWGKTDLDRQMPGAVVGRMMLITQEGTRSTPNGNMYLYDVRADKSNTMEVELPQAESSESEEQSVHSAVLADEAQSTDDLFEEPAPAPVRRGPNPAHIATSPTAERQARVQALLNSRSSK